MKGLPSIFLANHTDAPAATHSVQRTQPPWATLLLMRVNLSVDWMPSVEVLVAWGCSTGCMVVASQQNRQGHVATHYDQTQHSLALDLSLVGIAGGPGLIPITVTQTVHRDLGRVQPHECLHDLCSLRKRLTVLIDVYNSVNLLFKWHFGSLQDNSATEQLACIMPRLGTQACPQSRYNVENTR